MLHTEVARTDTPELFNAAVERAAALLAAGELVAIPTETVYGLAANALDAEAVTRIYAAKGRPANNPTIVHIGSEAMARDCAAHWPSSAHVLAQSFWPGPLTVVLPRAVKIPDVVTSGGDTVGIRWPNHPFVEALIRRCAFPLAAPSANPSNRVSPTTASHVYEYFKGHIPLVVDGGPATVGIESTVLDLTEDPPRVLRPGMIHDAALAAVIGSVALGDSDAPRILKSPGQFKRHYSPRARLMVAAWQDESELQALAATKGHAANIHVLSHTHIPSAGLFTQVSILPRDPAGFARALYSELLECDRLGAGLIIVEAPPPGPQWRAVSDRLARAAAKD